jgi:hypothetical protein
MCSGPMIPPFTTKLLPETILNRGDGRMAQFARAAI